MKILRCHDCGEKPVYGDLNLGQDWNGWDCACQEWPEGHTPEAWNTIQRRKRMRMKWEFVVANTAHAESKHLEQDAEYWLSSLFGPAEGEECDV